MTKALFSRILEPLFTLLTEIPPMNCFNMMTTIITTIMSPT
ncbi:hypothetical protein MHA_0134 [Mannheimia haemolytica PHL213]|nr:hypothetical protein MHA_0134 [Mannheimia haemolytica PHL213]